MTEPSKEAKRGNITDEMRDKWGHRIEFCISRQAKLTEWELGFIDSIKDLKDLSLKQSFKLGEVYRRLRDA